MKANVKKLLALVMAMAMVLSLAAPAFAGKLDTQATASVDARNSSDFTVKSVTIDKDGQYTVTYDNKLATGTDVTGGTQTVTAKPGEELTITYAKDSNVTEVSRVNPDGCKAGKVAYKVALKGQTYTEENIKLPGNGNHDYKTTRTGEVVKPLCADADGVDAYKTGVAAKYSVGHVCTVCGDPDPKDPETPATITAAIPTSHTKTNVTYCVDKDKWSDFEATLKKLGNIEYGNAADADAAKKEITNVQLSGEKPVAIKNDENAVYAEGFKCTECNRVLVFLRTIKADGVVLSEPNAVPYTITKDNKTYLDTSKNVTFKAAEKDGVITYDSETKQYVIDMSKADSENFVDNTKPNTEDEKFNAYNWATPTALACGKEASYIERQIDSNGVKVKDTDKKLAVSHISTEVYVENPKFVLGYPTDTDDQSANYDFAKGTLKSSVTDSIKAASCGQDGSYDVVVYCTHTTHQNDAKWDKNKNRYEVSRQTITVKASDKHIKAAKPVYRNVTATLEKDGTAEAVTLCEQCKTVLKSETVTVTKDEVKACKDAVDTGPALAATAKDLGFTYGDMVEVEGTRVEPTAYKPGSVKMGRAYTLGEDKLGGGVTEAVNKVLPATGKHKYTYAICFEKDASSFVLNKDTADAIVKNASDAEVYIGKTDVDYTKLSTAEKKTYLPTQWAAAEAKAKVTITTPTDVDVEKELDKDYVNAADATNVKGTIKVELTAEGEAKPCAYGTKTFTATVADATAYGTALTLDSVSKTFSYYEKADANGKLPAGVELAKHVAGAGVVENENAETGYYEVATYCTNCNVELSRTPGFKTPTVTKTKKNIAECTITVGAMKYTGNEQKLKVTVVDSEGNKLAKGIDYLVEDFDEVDAGTYDVAVVGTGENWTGSTSVAATIKKVAGTLKKKSAPTTLTASASKKVTGQIKMTVKGGKVSAYKVTGKVSGVSVNKSGKITVKKGNKKSGTLKVKVTMKADNNHTAAKAVTVKVAIKAAPAAKKTTKKK